MIQYSANSSSLQRSVSCTMVKQLIRRCTAAAAFSTLKASSAFAFHVTNTSPITTITNVNRGAQPLTHSGMSSRMFFSRNNENDSNKSVKSKLSSLLPSFLRRKDKKTQKADIVQKRNNDLSAGIDTILKDAPLPVRMMGKMIAPIIGQVAGTMMETMEEQSRMVDQLMEDAKNLIIQDTDSCRELGGTPIQVGRPFNQSSSSMSVNGQTKSSIQAQFEVQGSTGSGIATIFQQDGKVSSLNLNINGRTFNIDVKGGRVGSSSSVKQSSSNVGKNRNINEGDFIDAEFVDKVEK